MIHNLNFIRRNQKSYIRISCEYDVPDSYEYQMCKHNILNSLLDFQQRSQNGENYLYYEISGMQPLDIFLQTQKLKRPFAIILAKAILKLCKELSEYALSIHSVVFQPKYIMISANADEVRFLYSFQQAETQNEGIEQLLECCVEHLDYQDETLMEQLYRVYECLLNQKDNFFFAAEMEAFVEALSEEKIMEISENLADNMEAQDLFSTKNKKETVSVPQQSKIAQKEYRNLKIGLVVLLLIDIVVLVVWKPLTILKLFLAIAAGSVLLGLNYYVHKQEKSRAKESLEQQQRQEYLEEYAELTKNCDIDSNGTQIISIEDSEGVLYNLQNCEPQYIYIGDTRKIIGKDPQKAQVCIQRDGVSRIHALVVKEGRDCFIEDLNSTNGTWVNGKVLEPRVPYALKQGDKVCFADLEYIFR